MLDTTISNHIPLSQPHTQESRVASGSRAGPSGAQRSSPSVPSRGSGGERAQDSGWPDVSSSVHDHAREAEREETEAFRLMEELVERRALLAHEERVARGRAEELAAARSEREELAGWVTEATQNCADLRGAAGEAAREAERRAMEALAMAGRAQAEAAGLAEAAEWLTRAACVCRVPWASLDAWRTTASELPDVGPRLGERAGRVAELRSSLIDDSTTGLTGRVAWRAARHAGSDDEEEMGSLTRRVEAEKDFSPLMEVGFDWEDGARWSSESRHHPEVRRGWALSVLMERSLWDAFRQFGQMCMKRRTYAPWGLTVCAGQRLPRVWSGRIRAPPVPPSRPLLQPFRAPMLSRRGGFRALQVVGGRHAWLRSAPGLR